MFSRFKKHIAVLVTVMMIVTCLPFGLLVSANEVPVTKYIFVNRNNDEDLLLESTDDPVAGYNLIGVYVANKSFTLTDSMRGHVIIANNADIDGTPIGVDDDADFYLFGDSTLKVSDNISYDCINPDTEFTDELTAENLLTHIMTWKDEVTKYYAFHVTDDLEINAPGEYFSERNLIVDEGATFTVNACFDASNAEIEGNVVVKDSQIGEINYFMISYTENSTPGKLSVGENGSITGEDNTELIISKNSPVTGLALYDEDGVTPIALGDEHEDATFIYRDGKWVVGEIEEKPFEWGPGMVISNWDWQIKNIQYSVDDGVTKRDAVSRDGEFFISLNNYENADSIRIYPELWQYGADISYEVLWDKTGNGETVHYNTTIATDEYLELPKIDEDWGVRIDIDLNIEYTGIIIFYDEDKVDGITYQFDGDDFSYVLGNHHISDYMLEGETGVTITIDPKDDVLVRPADCFYFKDYQDYPLGAPEFTGEKLVYRLEPSAEGWYEQYHIHFPMSFPGVDVHYEPDHVDEIKYQFENSAQKTLNGDYIDADEIEGDVVRFTMDLKDGASVDQVEFISINENGQEYSRVYTEVDSNDSVLISKPVGWDDWGKYLEVNIYTSRPGMRLDFDMYDWNVWYSVDNGGTKWGINGDDKFIPANKYQNADNIIFYASPARDDMDPDFMAGYTYFIGDVESEWIDVDTSEHEFVIEKPADGWYSDYNISIFRPEEPQLQMGINLSYNDGDIEKIEYAFDGGTDYVEIPNSRVIDINDLYSHRSVTFRVTLMDDDVKLKDVGVWAYQSDGENDIPVDLNEDEFVQDLDNLTFTVNARVYRPDSGEADEGEEDIIWLDKYEVEFHTSYPGLDFWYDDETVEKIEYVVGNVTKTVQDSTIHPEELAQMPDGIAITITFKDGAVLTDANVQCDYDNGDPEYRSMMDQDPTHWTYDEATGKLTFTFPDGFTWGKYNVLAITANIPGMELWYMDSEMKVSCFGHEVKDHFVPAAEYANAECVVFTVDANDESKQWEAEYWNNDTPDTKTRVMVENGEFIISRPENGWNGFYSVDIHEYNENPGPQGWPEAGNFIVDYDMRMIGWPGTQSAFVKVGGIDVATNEIVQFTSGTPITFTLVPPEGYENVAPVIVIENDEGVKASTIDNTITVTNHEFTYTPTSNKGFIVRLWWSHYDSLNPTGDEIMVCVQIGNKGNVSVVNSKDSDKSPISDYGIDTYRFIVDKSEIADNGSIKVVFSADEPAVISGCFVTDYRDQQTEYTLNDMTLSDEFSYNAQTGEWTYNITALPGENESNIMGMDINAAEPETFTSFISITAEGVGVEYAYVRNGNDDPFVEYTGKFDTDTTADAIKIKFTPAQGETLNPVRIGDVIPFGPVAGRVVRLGDDNILTLEKNPQDGWHAYMIDFEEDGMPADGEFIIKLSGYDSNPVLNYEAETFYTFEPGATVTINLGDEEPAYVVAYDSRMEIATLERGANGTYSYNTNANWPEALVIKIYKNADDKDFEDFVPAMDEMPLEFHVFYNDYPDNVTPESVVRFNAPEGKWKTSSDGTRTVIHVKNDIESFSFDVWVGLDECRDHKIMLNGVDVTDQTDEHGFLTIDADTIRAGMDLRFIFNYRRTFEINRVIGENGYATIPDSAREGDTVTVTGINAYEGYELDAVTVRYGQDQYVLVDSNHSFVMPSSDVSVYVTFKKINYTITKEPMENGDVTVKSTATMGEQVTVTAVPAAGYELGTLDVATVNGGYVPVNNGVFTMPAEDVIVSATFVEHISEPAKVTSRTLDLNDRIGINFKLSLPAEILADANAYISIVHGNASEKWPIASAPKDGAVYVFRHYVAAAQMRDDVVLSVRRGDGTVYPLLNREGEDVTSTGFVYCAEDYVEAARAAGANPNLLAVLNRMVDFGKYAQIYFKYNADVGSLTPEAETLMAGVTLSTLNKFEPVIVTASGSPITRTGSNLELKDATVLTHNFVIAEGYSIDDFVITVDGNVVTMDSTGPYKIVFDGSKYKVVISGIAAAELQKTHKVIVKNLAGEVLVAIGNYSALSYVRTVVEKVNPSTAPADQVNLLNTVKALYLYNRAAMVYWNQEDDVATLDEDELPIIAIGQDAAEEVAVAEEPADEVEALDAVEATDEVVVDETEVTEVPEVPEVTEVEEEPEAEVDEVVDEPTEELIEEPVIEE